MSGHKLKYLMWCCHFQTNTFQCILTTDGVRSFALLRYGEMRWRPGQRLYHDALIGYTDGISYHKEPTVPPENLFGPGGRYRPQQMRGITGKLGQLVYNLTGPVGPDMDPSIRCQAWAMKEPDPAVWAKGLISCPCTRTQAMEDLSFLQDTTDPGSWVKTLRGQRWGGAGGHIFQSILSNRHGSGKRCVYELDGPLLAGYSERYFSGRSMQKHIGTYIHVIFHFWSNPYKCLIYCTCTWTLVESKSRSALKGWKSYDSRNKVSFKGTLCCL